jgi:glucose-1-phosphate adenylyltransferase
MLSKKNILTFILAGGKGSRLYPLTRDRAKPAVPFAGRYRIIDFVLSNCINSGLRQIYLATQTKSLSLDKHIRNHWSFLSHELDEFIASVPAQQRISDDWYAGTADAIYQNIHLLEDRRPEHVLILSGDHIYNMDYSELYREHIDHNADLSVAVIQMDKNQAHEFGVLSMDQNHRITSFQEKPQDPSLIPGAGDRCHINMGIYLFRTDALVRELSADTRKFSDHDFGKNIIPNMLKDYHVHAFPFEQSRFGDYWQDVGTIRSYYQANMNFIKQSSTGHANPDGWKIQTKEEPLPPSFFGGQKVQIVNSLIGTGSRLADCSVNNSLIGRNVTIGKGTVVENSIVMSHTTIGENCIIKNSILDEKVSVLNNWKIGVDPEQDKKYFMVSDGIAVLPKNFRTEL